MELKIHEVKNFSGGSDVLALSLILNVAYLLHLNLHLKCRFRSVDFSTFCIFNKLPGAHTLRGKISYTTLLSRR